LTPVLICAERAAECGGITHRTTEPF